MAPFHLLLIFENPNGYEMLLLNNARVNIKYQGPKDMAPFHLLLIFENPNGFEM